MIKLGDKTYNLRFNYNVLDSVEKDTGIDPFSERAGGATFIKYLTYYAIKEHSRTTKSTDSDGLTLEDVGADLTPAIHLEVTNQFTREFLSDGGEESEGK